MRQLNQVLSVKKEDVLKYQDQIANMKAELAELRDARMEGVCSEGGRERGRVGEKRGGGERVGREGERGVGERGREGRRVDSKLRAAV